MLEGEEGIEKFKQLIKAYFDSGGMEIQFNIVNGETLLRAQESPSEYHDLVVRVSGYSNYFTSLDKVLQDEIISRTFHDY